MPVSRSELGRGAVAGLAGTVAYTALSAQLKQRSGAPAAPRPLGVSTVQHWGYGAWGGVVRALVEHRGLRGPAAEAAHLGAFWLPWRLLLAAAGKRTGARALAVDLAKHTVYVGITGLAYRALAHQARGGRR